MANDGIDLSNPDTYTEHVPYAEFARLRREAPVARRHEHIGGEYWAVTRHADVVKVLKTPAVFSSARMGSLISDPPPAFLPTIRQGMLHRDPPDHTKLRRVVNQEFTPSRVVKLERQIEVRAAALVDAVAGSGECDYARDVAGEMPVQVICDILGVPMSDRGGLTKLTERMLESPLRDPAAAMQDTLGAVAEMKAYGNQLADEKRAHPTDDLLSDLIHGEAGQTLTQGEFEALFVLLFNAGSDTTKSLLAFGVNLLLERPELWERLQREPELVGGAVEEMLRFEPPVIQFRRTASRDTELNGVQIREGEKVVVFFPSANRDESVFERPDEFDIERKQNDHLSFGYGTHFCLGAPLARVEAKHVLLQSLARFDSPKRIAPLVTNRSNFVRGVRSLQIKFEPRART
jgi:cholest-4-en-3-one 26-monooxygenase